jgi:hypothetical protein
MYSVWTDHLKTPEDKERFRSSLESAKPVLDRLQAILDDKATAIDTAERSVANYDNPNWAYRQAHRNGCMSTIYGIKSLITLDQQK